MKKFLLGSLLGSLGDSGDYCLCCLAGFFRTPALTTDPATLAGDAARWITANCRN